MRGLAKAGLEPAVDVAGLIEPLGLAVVALDAKAGHLDLAAAFVKRGLVLRIVLGVAGFDVEVQACDLLAHLDAERTAAKLVKRKPPASLVYPGLLLWRALLTFGRGEFFRSQHERCQYQPNAAKEGANHTTHRVLPGAFEAPFERVGR